MHHLQPSLDTIGEVDTIIDQAIIEQLADSHTSDELLDEIREERQQLDSTFEQTMRQRYNQNPLRVNVEALMGLHAATKLMATNGNLPEDIHFVLRNIIQLQADSLAYLAGTTIEEIQADVDQLQQTFDYQQHLQVQHRIDLLQSALQLKLTTAFATTDDDAPPADLSTTEDTPTSDVEAFIVTSDGQVTPPPLPTAEADPAMARRQAILQEVLQEEDTKHGRQRVIRFTDSPSDTTEEEDHNEEE